MRTKTLNILSYLFIGICKSDIGYFGTICIIHMHVCCQEIIRFLKCPLLSGLKIDFDGDTFVARQRNTNDIFQFHL